MPLSPRNLLGLCLAAALFAAGPTLAQEATGRTPLGANSAMAVPDAIMLSLNKAQIFEFPTDVRDVLVSNPAIADVVVRTPRLIYVLGREVGDTNVFFFDDEGRIILQREIRVELDLTGLRMALAAVLPDDPVEVTAVNQNIVLTGAVRSAVAAEDARLIARRFVEDDDQIINMIRIGSDQQVMLRLRIAEVSRTVVKQLGLQTSFSLGGLTTSLAFASGVAAPATAFGLAAANLIGPSALGTGPAAALAGATDGRSASFNAVLDLLESQGLVKTLAEPNLTAVSGENANLLVGGEFPVPVNVTVDQGAVTVDIEFKQFGILLTFTPVVLSSGLISLKLSTEVSALLLLVADGALEIFTGGGNSTIIPALSVNRAETTVELASGGSMIVAGLLQDDIRNTIRGTPGLKDIPVLGALFRSEDFQKDETELIIAITTYLVSPIGEQEITLPTDGFAPASDFDLYFLGRLHDVYTKPGSKPQAGRLRGPVGYIME